MTRSLAVVSVFSIAGLFLAPCVPAQTSPGCGSAITDPLQALAGSWTFSTRGTVFPTQLSAEPFASVGSMVAAIGTNRAGIPVGLLTITKTASQNGQSLARQETDAGTFQVLPDCSGGTLTFNLSSRPVQFDFRFVNGTEIRFVSTSQGVTIAGVALGISSGQQYCFDGCDRIMEDPTCFSTNANTCVVRYINCRRRCKAGWRDLSPGI